MVVPASKASPRPARPPPSSATVDTRTTATRATAIPRMTIVGRLPSMRNPAATGMSAARTPVTGATMPMRPTARPWYSAEIPTAPSTPPTTATPMSSGSGAVSPRISISARASTMPVTCETSTTP